MKIAGADAAPLRLLLRRPLRTAHERLLAREGLRVRVRDRDGRVGLGECMPLPAFGTESLAVARAALERALPALAGAECAAPGALPEAVAAAVEGAPTARAALDGALHDLAAQAAELPLAGLLARAAGGRARTRVPASRLLVEDEPEALRREAARAAEEGFPALKLKVGALDAARDAARVAAARAGAGAEVALGLDANGAWSRDEALRRLEALARHDVAWIEQPVPAAALADLAFVRRRSPVPVAADEAALRLEDARRVLEEGAADRLVLKPAALGGLAPACAVAALARSADVEVQVTSFLDGAVGVTTALHFAAGLPDPLPPCGLATGDQLEGDPLAFPELRAGRLVVPAGPGLGVAPRQGP